MYSAAAHLDNDPLRRAPETIASQISAALDGTSGAKWWSDDNRPIRGEKSH